MNVRVYGSVSIFRLRVHLLLNFPHVKWSSQGFPWISIQALDWSFFLLDLTKFPLGSMNRSFLNRVYRAPFRMVLESCGWLVFFTRFYPVSPKYIQVSLPVNPTFSSLNSVDEIFGERLSLCLVANLIWTISCFHVGENDTNLCAVSITNNWFNEFYVIHLSRNTLYRCKDIRIRRIDESGNSVDSNFNGLNEALSLIPPTSN